MAVKRAEVIPNGPKCCQSTISSRSTRLLATATQLLTTQPFGLSKVSMASSLNHFSGQIYVSSDSLSVSKKANTTSYCDRGHSSQSSFQNPVDTLNTTTTSRSNATSIHSLSSTVSRSTVATTRALNKLNNDKRNSIVATTSIDAIPSKQSNELNRSKTSSITISIQETISKERIGPYRRAAMSVVAKRSFLKPEVPKKNRRFPCYVSGYLKLSPPRPSRCWPLTTEEEDEGDELRGQIEWERYSSMNTNWEPENGW